MHPSRWSAANLNHSFLAAIWVIAAVRREELSRDAMPIDQRWNTLTAADWDAFACAWLAELRGEADDDSDMGQRVVMMNFTSTAQHQWLFITAAIGHAKTDDELGHIAAGPVEHILGKRGDDNIDRVEGMSASNPRFKKMMIGVWKHMMNDNVWKRVQAIQTSANAESEEPERDSSC